ncbi:hypothetical protein GGX14DRAFT_587243 [Mycena pura]|uniref:F-box domain-containing protein n=1 Tax=Mycena pura TaxID=153505 RepID=A0AAD6Y2V5_9AGAR|nr:hypothetical protein GGX14DRAFT_587243 [Mycena pura]
MACPSRCSHCGFSVLDIAAVPSPHPYLSSASYGTPSNLEAAAIQNAVNTAEQNIITVDKEVERLQRALDQLSARRTELEDFRMSHKSAISSLRKLPNEILGEIFLLADFCWNEMFKELCYAPKWIVTRVCTGWRAVATSTPSLWAKISVGPWSKGRLSDRCFACLLSQQVKWTGESPLVVSYMTGDKDGLDILLSVADRWRDAFLSMQDENLQSLRNFTGSFPSLEKFRSFLDVELEDRVKIYSISPRLRDVELPPHPDPTVFPLHWAQLEYCALPYAPRDVFRILPLMSSIVSLSLKGLFRGDPDVWNAAVGAPQTISETLRTLTLSNYKTSAASIFAFLVAPSLRQLVIDNSYPRQEFIPFLIRSGCPLTHLTLKNVQMHVEIVLKALTLTPHLEELVMNDLGADNTISDTFVGALTCLSDAHHLVPNLVFLSITGCFACESSLVVKMLRSRNAATGAGKLRSVRLFWYSGSPHVPLVEELEDEGLDMRCSHLGQSTWD